MYSSSNTPANAPAKTPSNTSADNPQANQQDTINHVADNTALNVDPGAASDSNPNLSAASIPSPNPSPNTGLNLTEIEPERITFLKPDYLYEAAVALSRKPGDREFFLDSKESSELSMEDPEMLRERYKLQDTFVKKTLDYKEKQFSAEQYKKYEPFLTLVPVQENQFALLPSLLMGTHRQERTVEGLTSALISLYHKELSQLFDYKSLTEEYIAPQPTNPQVSASPQTTQPTTSPTSQPTSQPTTSPAPQLTTQPTKDTIDFTNLSDVVTAIMNLETESDRKVRLIELYQREEEIFRVFAEQLIPLAQEIEKLTTPLQAEIAERFKPETLLPHLETNLSRYLTYKIPAEDHVTISPMLIQAGTLSFQTDDENNIKIQIGLYALERMDNSQAIEKSLEHISQAGKMFADPTRLKVIMLLRQRPMYLKELALQLDLSSATMSHHMQQLLDSGLVRVDASELTRTNRRIYYSLAKAAFLNLGEMISSIGAADTIDIFASTNTDITNNTKQTTNT